MIDPVRNEATGESQNNSEAASTGNTVAKDAGSKAKRGRGRPRKSAQAPKPQERKTLSRGEIIGRKVKLARNGVIGVITSTHYSKVRVKPVEGGRGRPHVIQRVSLVPSKNKGYDLLEQPRM